MHCTIRHLSFIGTVIVDQQESPEMFFLQKLLYHQCHVQNKREKKQSTEQIFSGLYEDLPYLLWRAMEAAWGQSQYPVLLVLLIFPGALMYCLVCSSFWVSTKGGTLTGYKSGTLSFCSVAENFVTGYPFFLEGLCKIHGAQSEQCRDSGFQQSF